MLVKMRICKYFARGHCMRGKFCTFTHRDEQWYSQTDLFRTNTCYASSRNGTCRAGCACNFKQSSKEGRPADVDDVTSAERASRQQRWPRMTPTRVGERTVVRDLFSYLQDLDVRLTQQLESIANCVAALQSSGGKPTVRCDYTYRAPYRDSNRATSGTLTRYWPAGTTAPLNIPYSTDLLPPGFVSMGPAILST